MRSRKSLAVLACAVAAVTVLAACGTGTSAQPTGGVVVSTTASSASPVPSSDPTVTVPGLPGSSSSAVPSASTSSQPVSSSPAKPTSAATPAGSSTPPRSSSTPAPDPTTTKATADPTTADATTADVTTQDPTTSDPTTPAPTSQRPVTTAPAEPTTKPSTPQPSTPEANTPKPSTPEAGTPKANTPKDPAAVGGTMTKKLVVIDPGHNGQNHAHPEIIKQQVDAGFGERKDCNTTGTETNDGYTEALFNWKVALALKAQLEAKGITVVMTRDSNDGVGPCVNERAAVGNEQKPAAVISIHGDGDDATAHGFYVMTAERDPAGAAMAGLSARLATDVRDSLQGGGFTPSTHLGENGLWKRGDLAGLNLSQVPTVMIEMGNMRNAGDAKTMSSSSGQSQYAAGISAGVVQYLIGR